MLITKKRTALVLFTCITVPTAYIIPEIFTQILADRHTDEKIDKQIDKPVTILRSTTADVEGCRCTIRHDTRCYFNVRSKADTSQLNLPHGNNN